MRTLAMLALATVGALVGGVAAAIDFTGDWMVHVHVTSPIEAEGSERWAVQQTGMQLTVRVNGGSPHGGFIDPMTGDFQVDLGPGPSVPFQCPDTTASGTVAADGQTFTGTSVGYFEHVTPPAGCFTTTADLSGSRSLCGNGTVDPGEDCDDGNVMDGDCCSSTCRFEPAGVACGGTGVCGAMSCNGTGTCQNVPATVCGTTCLPGSCGGGSCVQSLAPAGTACSADGNACTVEACDGAGNCVSQSAVTCPACQSCDEFAGCIDHPQIGCASLPVRPLRLRTGDATRHKVAFAARDPALVTYFLDPVNGPSGAVLCVFDMTSATARTLTDAVVPAGGTCRGKPCWKAIRDGYQYRDPDATHDGVSAITLRASEAKGSAIQAKGGGPNLALPTSFTNVTHVLVQLTNGPCLEARYDSIDVGVDGRQLTGR